MPFDVIIIIIIIYLRTQAVTYQSNTNEIKHLKQVFQDRKAKEH